MSCVLQKDLPQELHVSCVVDWAVADCCLHLCCDKSCLRRKDYAQVPHVSWMVGWAVLVVFGPAAPLFSGPDVHPLIFGI